MSLCTSFCSRSESGFGHGALGNSSQYGAVGTLGLLGDVQENGVDPVNNSTKPKIKTD